jgi:hypothetical protein
MSTAKVQVLTEQNLMLNGVKEFPIERQYMSQGAPGAYSTHKNVHMGQRKLLLSEVQFLTTVYNLDVSEARRGGKLPRFLVVYAGACPCLHLDELLAMYEHVDFLLVDPAFNALQNRGCFTRWDKHRVSVCVELFNDDTVRDINSWCVGKDEHNWVHRALNSLWFCRGDLNGTNLLFISDIRLDARDDFVINQDMQSQARWLQNLGASHSLLKFRLPYCDPEVQSETYKYLDGDVYLPVFGPRSTTECRLHVNRYKLDYKTKNYDPEKHERVMAGFNSYDRGKEYQCDIPRISNIVCNIPGGETFTSFDHAAEAIIMYQYRACMSQYHCPIRVAYEGNSIQPSKSLNFWKHRSWNPDTRPTKGRQRARASTHPGIQHRSWNPGTRPTKGRQRARASTSHQKVYQLYLNICVGEMHI